MKNSKRHFLRHQKGIFPKKGSKKPVFLKGYLRVQIDPHRGVREGPKMSPSEPGGQKKGSKNGCPFWPKGVKNRSFSKGLFEGSKSTLPGGQNRGPTTPSPGGCRWFLRSLDSKTAKIGSFWTPPRGSRGSKKGSKWPFWVILAPPGQGLTKNRLKMSPFFGYFRYFR